MPSQILKLKICGEILTYFKKKIVQICPLKVELQLSKNCSHFQIQQSFSYLKQSKLDQIGQFFFSIRSEFHQEFIYLISCKVWFGILN